MTCLGVKLKQDELFLFDGIAEIFLEGSRFHIFDNNHHHHQQQQQQQATITDTSSSSALSASKNEQYILLRYGLNTVLRFIEKVGQEDEQGNQVTKKEVRIHHHKCKFLNHQIPTAQRDNTAVRSHEEGEVSCEDCKMCYTEVYRKNRKIGGPIQTLCCEAMSAKTSRTAAATKQVLSFINAEKDRVSYAVNCLTPKQRKLVIRDLLNVNAINPQYFLQQPQAIPTKVVTQTKNSNKRKIDTTDIVLMEQEHEAMDFDISNDSSYDPSSFLENIFQTPFPFHTRNTHQMNAAAGGGPKRAEGFDEGVYDNLLATVGDDSQLLFYDPDITDNGGDYSPTLFSSPPANRRILFSASTRNKQYVHDENGLNVEEAAMSGNEFLTAHQMPPFPDTTLQSNTTSFEHRRQKSSFINDGEEENDQDEVLLPETLSSESREFLSECQRRSDLSHYLARELSRLQLHDDDTKQEQRPESSCYENTLDGLGGYDSREWAALSTPTMLSPLTHDKLNAIISSALLTTKAEIFGYVGAVPDNEVADDEAGNVNSSDDRTKHQQSIFSPAKRQLSNEFILPADEERIWDNLLFGDDDVLRENGDAGSMYSVPSSAEHCLEEPLEFSSSTETTPEDSFQQSTPNIPKTTVEEDQYDSWPEYLGGMSEFVHTHLKLLMAKLDEVIKAVAEIEVRMSGGDSMFGSNYRSSSSAAAFMKAFGEHIVELKFFRDLVARYAQILLGKKLTSKFHPESTNALVELFISLGSNAYSKVQALIPILSVNTVRKITYENHENSNIKIDAMRKMGELLLSQCAGQEDKVEPNKWMFAHVGFDSTKIYKEVKVNHNLRSFDGFSSITTCGDAAELVTAKSSSSILQTAMAEHGTVFMVTPVHLGSAARFVAAVYYHRNESAAVVLQMFYEVDVHLRLAGFIPIDISTDFASWNQKAMDLLLDSPQSTMPAGPYEQPHLISGRMPYCPCFPMYFIPDIAHLLKALRNAFANRLLVFLYVTEAGETFIAESRWGDHYANPISNVQGGIMSTSLSRKCNVRAIFESVLTNFGKMKVGPAMAFFSPAFTEICQNVVSMKLPGAKELVFPDNEEDKPNFDVLFSDNALELLLAATMNNTNYNINNNMEVAMVDDPSYQEALEMARTHAATLPIRNAAHHWFKLANGIDASLSNSKFTRYVQMNKHTIDQYNDQFPALSRLLDKHHYDLKNLLKDDTAFDEDDRHYFKNLTAYENSFASQTRQSAGKIGHGIPAVTRYLVSMYHDITVHLRNFGTDCLESFFAFFKNIAPLATQTSLDIAIKRFNTKKILVLPGKVPSLLEKIHQRRDQADSEDSFLPKSISAKTNNAGMETADSSATTEHAHSTRRRRRKCVSTVSKNSVYDHMASQTPVIFGVSGMLSKNNIK